MLKTFIGDMARYLPSKLLPALTGFIAAPILTRLFLPDEYGFYVLAAGIPGLLFALAGSGFGAGTIRFFPAYKVKSELGTFFATLTISIGVVIAVVSTISFVGLYLLRNHLPDVLYPLLLISVLIFVVEALFSIFVEVLRAQERSGLYTIFQLISNYGGLGLGLLFVIGFGLRVEGLLWGTLLSLCMVLPFLLYLSSKGVSIRIQDFRQSYALQMWRYAWPLAIGNLAMWGLMLSDRYIISLFRSESEVGLYSVAYNLSSKSIDMLVALFLLSMGPMVMNTWESQGREATEKSVAMITRLFLIVCLPAAAGLNILASPFVALLTTEPYHEGHRIVGYVAFSSFVWGLSQIACLGILIKKKTHLVARNQIVAALINISLNVVLIPRFGFVVAGITTLVGYIVLLILQAYASRPYLFWRFPLRTLLNVVIATIFMGLVVSGVYGMSGNSVGVHIGYLFLSIVVAIPVYCVSLWVLGEVNGEEKASIRNFWYRLKPGNLRSEES